MSDDANPQGMKRPLIKVSKHNQPQGQGYSGKRPMIPVRSRAVAGEGNNPQGVTRPMLPVKQQEESWYSNQKKGAPYDQGLEPDEEY